jgi:methionyl-tRNA formyltransferase
MNYPKQRSGFTIHWMNKKIDDGNIIISKKVKIKKNDTAEKLYFRIEKELLFFLKRYFFKNLEHYLSIKGFKNNKSIYYKKNDINSKIQENINSRFNRKKLIKALTFKQFNKKSLKKI